MRQGGRRTPSALVEDSCLRRVDARVKLALSLTLSFAVMLPLGRLIPFAVVVLFMLVMVGLPSRFGREIYRLRWLLVVLFVVDWFFVSFELAVAVTVRLCLLVGSFQILLATTSPDELHRALAQLGLSQRVAFSLGIAQQALALLQDDMRRIVEAQRARGVAFEMRRGSLAARWKTLRRDGLAVLVPTIVVATQRAWAAHESAAARGFDGDRSPVPPSRSLHARDRAWLGGAVVLVVLLLWWR